MEKINSEKQVSTWQWAYALCVAFGLVNNGATFALSAVLIPALEKETDASLNISVEEGTYLVLCLLVFFLIGNLLSGFPADILGRWPVMVASQMLFPLSWITMATSTTYLHVLVSRVMMGTANGVYFAVAIVYLSEISHSTIRGSLVGSVMIGQNMGIALIYSLGKLFQWRTYCWIMSVFSSLTVLTIIFALNETPHHLILMNKEKKARSVLQKLRGKHFDITEELEEMLEHKKKLQEEHAHGGLQVKIDQFISTLLSKKFVRPILITFPLSFCLGISGMFNLKLYIITIFQESDTNIDPFLASIALALTRIVVSCLAPIALKMFSKRKLYSISFCIVSICYGLVALNYYYAEVLKYYKKNEAPDEELYQFLSNIPDWLQNDIVNWTPIVCLTIAVIVYSLGVEAVLKVLTAELFPTQVRSLGSGVSFVGLITSIIIASSSLPYLLKYCYFHGTFAIYSIVSLFTAILSYLIIPETNGKTLINVQKDFEQ